MVDYLFDKMKNYDENMKKDNYNTQATPTYKPP